MERDTDRLYTVMAACWQLRASQLFYQMRTMFSHPVETNQVGYRTEYRFARWPQEGDVSSEKTSIR